ncbi:ureidoglycolate lyase [Microbacterium sp. ASV49]|uniref:Ureidoglycolate lyase n=1 Tax=Microbacterium candidum TaxID=3041922 RepID=A0ABT7N3I3_9MICO|nr:ureidoglycolate lyase [Microbacterium sp. ASV49]MDL9981267.1 ureidoglycolate lyase [Microbacterium sp. ASV49]
MTNRTVVAEPLGRADLTGVGRAFDLAQDSAGAVFSEGPGFTDRYTSEPLLDGTGHLGMTSVSAAPGEVTRMERHLYTAEALFCAGDPVVLPIAPAGRAPRTSDLRALLILPGEGIVLDPGVWHAPCLGATAPAAYYWFAEVDESVETAWVELDEGPVSIDSGVERDHVG